MSDTDKLVTIDLQGGLGNQLFMLSTCLAYAWDHNRKPVFRYRTILPNETTRPTYWDTICKNIKTKRYDVHVDIEYKEPNFKYTTIPIMSHNTVKLQGYFQSYQYFHHHREKLLSLLDLAIVPRPGTCSMHFRLDDYKKHPDIYPLMPVSYYVRALVMIYEHYDVQQVLWFADPKSTQEAAAMVSQISQLLPHVKLVHNTGMNDHEELLAMAGCEYHVIANSSFSWWGAYLAKSKVVCYPKLWLHKEDTSTMCSPGWVRID